MVSGQYQAQLGDKNRIAIPKKLREELNGNIYITRGFERKSLIIFDDLLFKNFIAEIDKGSIFSNEFRSLKRYFVGGLSQLDYDIQGRFVLNESLKNFAEIKSSVVFLGINNWIELWDSEIWSLTEEKITNNLNTISLDFLKDLKNDK